MRRKTKYILGWGILGSAMTAIIDTLDQWIDHKNKGIDFTWQTYDGKRTVRRSIVGGAVGATIGYGIYQYKLSEEEAIPFNSNYYLKSVLTQENIKSDPILLKNVLNKRREILEWLNNKYNLKLADIPQNTGSFYRRTAIASDFDIDIILPFKKNAFKTLEEMYDNVFHSIKTKYENIASISTHKKAIELIFEIDGKDIFIDVVPGREINDYKTDKDLQLYVNPNWAWEKGSSFKTNIGLQKTLTNNKSEARKVIKLLKIYRNKTDLEISSLVIEQCVTNALSKNEYGLSFSIKENLLNSMEYLSKALRLNKYLDHSNTNNNLNSKVSTQSRYSSADQIIDDIKSIEENPIYLKEIFE